MCITLGLECVCGGGGVGAGGPSDAILCVAAVLRVVGVERGGVGVCRGRAIWLPL